MSEILPDAKYQPKEEASLQSRLQTELDFVYDQTGEWLWSDTLEATTAGDYCEQLPTITRLSAAGDQLEFGVHVDDIQKTLELERLKGRPAQDVDFVRGFWPEDSRYTQTEENGWLFIGAPIAPTLTGFEGNYSQIHEGISLALQGAAENLTYDDMKVDKWHGLSIEQAAHVETRPGNGIMILTKREEDDEPYEVDKTDWQYQLWDREARNLADYPIALNYRQLQRMPNTLKFDGREYSSGGGSLRSRNGENGVETVTFTASSYQKYGDGVLRYQIVFPISSPDVFKTLSDLDQVSQVSVRVVKDKAPFDDESVERLLCDKTMQANVKVDEHGVVVTCEKNDIELTMTEPACADCRQPLWQFRALTADEYAEANRINDSEIVWKGNMHTLQGDISYGRVGSKLVDNIYHEPPEVYCPDDFYKKRDGFVAEHPAASRSFAVSAIRKALDEIGRSEVLVDKEQVWPRSDSIEALTYLKYDRSGRAIHRIISAARIDVLSGEVSLDLPDPAIIDLR